MRYIAFAALVLAACSSSPVDPQIDAGQDSGVSSDAGQDAGADSGFDAGIDAGQDAGTDGGFDAAPACQCASGACCDGCYFRPNTYVCRDNVLYSTSCIGSSVCPGKGLTFRSQYDSRYCNGYSSDCGGTTFNDNTVDVNCDSSQGYPTYARCEQPADGGAAYCTWGPNCTTESP